MKNARKTKFKHQVRERFNRAAIGKDLSRWIVARLAAVEHSDG
jgi:hypothetical protein